MNSKKIKELRKLVKPIQVEWLRTLLPEDQADTITVENVDGLLPEETHAFGKGQLYLSYMSDKWIIKKLKKFPHITSFAEIAEVAKQNKQDNKEWMNM